MFYFSEQNFLNGWEVGQKTYFSFSFIPSLIHIRELTTAFYWQPIMEENFHERRVLWSFLKLRKNYTLKLQVQWAGFVSVRD